MNQLEKQQVSNDTSEAISGATMGEIERTAAINMSHQATMRQLEMMMQLNDKMGKMWVNMAKSINRD